MSETWTEWGVRRLRGDVGSVAPFERDRSCAEEVAAKWGGVLVSRVVRADEWVESPPRTHKTAPVSDPGLESGQGDHRDDEGRSGAQEEGK